MKKLVTQVINEIFRQITITLTLPLDVLVRPMDAKGLTSLSNRLLLIFQVMWLYEKYFATMKDITMTTLKILNDRIFSAHAKSVQQWNKRPVPAAVNNPLFLPITAPVNEGFTAVILTYDRLESLFQVNLKCSDYGMDFPA